MDNKAYEDDAKDLSTIESNGHLKKDLDINHNGVNNTSTEYLESNGSTGSQQALASDQGERESWGNSLEFLMSCIAMSVGLGNVWRFPFTALENGGGAFLLPYLVVLLVIGRPLYYLEMVLGQFSSRNSINVFDMAPFFRGSGVGQLVAIFLLSTYYASIMALVGHYFFDSFRSPLPWTICKDSWLGCVDPDGNIVNASTTKVLQRAVPLLNGSYPLISSSEYYFQKEVLQEAENIDDGIGMPIWNLALVLLLAWAVIAGVLIKGIQSSGKASYFLALFPYVVIGLLLVRAVTLEGAWKGIWYFLEPKWDKILEPKVWYAAITQCFFSLAVGFGNIIMYASFNKFSHNVYRDATIVTTLDTFTSMFAGFTIFGILGHLAHVLGTDIESVVKGGPGLAFISYPEAIARFDWAPQFFAILFFFMLFVLGIGSNIAMCTCIITIIRDKFKWMPAWLAAVGLATVGFLIGLIYVTPGGQWMLNLMDFYGTSFIVFFLTIGEIIAVSWVYGVNRLCRDIEFMINQKPGLYWRVCWGILTPLLMIVILIYTFISMNPISYNGNSYPNWAVALGWTISALGIMQFPIWATYAVLKQKGNPFKPTFDWGPKNAANFERYQKYVSAYEEQQRLLPRGNPIVRFKRHIFG